MTSERVRKCKIRARMAATGEPFTVAARVLDGDTVSFMRSGWSQSAWVRLLPVQSLTLEVIISTATARNQDGTLHQLISRHPARIFDLPEGADTLLTWDDDKTDEQTHSLRQQAQAAFHSAVTQTGRFVPSTVVELAELLSELGVYQRISTPNGVHQWRAQTDIPAAGDVLPLPPEWIALEDDVRWRTVTAHLALDLSDYFRQHGRPAQLNTTVQRMSIDYGQSIERVRDALDGMIYRNWLTVQRRDLTINRDELRQLPDHARITLIFDWSECDRRYDTEADDIELDDENIDDKNLSDLRWGTSPWAAFLSITENPQISEDSLSDFAHLPFRVKKPDGGTTVLSLDEMAAARCMSHTATAQVLRGLEQNNLLRWSKEHQYAELIEPNRA
ncbi:MAG: DUF6042 family protein [Pseudonocardiaceae bacterium]